MSKKARDHSTITLCEERDMASMTANPRDSQNTFLYTHISFSMNVSIPRSEQITTTTLAENHRHLALDFPPNRNRDANR